MKFTTVFILGAMAAAAALDQGSAENSDEFAFSVPIPEIVSSSENVDEFAFPVPVPKVQLSSGSAQIFNTQSAKSTAQGGKLKGKITGLPGGFGSPRQKANLDFVKRDMRSQKAKGATSGTQTGGFRMQGRPSMQTASQMGGQMPMNMKVQSSFQNPFQQPQQNLFRQSQLRLMGGKMQGSPGYIQTQQSAFVGVQQSPFGLGQQSQSMSPIQSVFQRGNKGGRAQQFGGFQQMPTVNQYQQMSTMSQYQPQQFQFGGTMGITPQFGGQSQFFDQMGGQMGGQMGRQMGGQMGGQMAQFGFRRG